MTPEEHENFAQDLLGSLSDDSLDSNAIGFVPNRTKSRNAAKAMTVILCHRIFTNSQLRPIHKRGTTFDWKNGTFNCRNIADRDYLWTNMRRGVAEEMHESAGAKPAAYLLASCGREDTKMNVWVIPEPIMYDSLASLQFEEHGKKYTVQVFPQEQRIHGYSESPDLTPYFREFDLRRHERSLLELSHEVDGSVKQAKRLLAKTAQQLQDTGAFDPNGIADARERVVSSILRRRGQPAFRKRMLAAYSGRCAVTDCDVELVLDAAHIIPYRGPETNHPGNGLLLRTDIHTLFDLKLVSVDEETMTVLVSTELAGTIYDEYSGMEINLLSDRASWPSKEALASHRRDAGL